MANYTAHYTGETIEKLLASVGQFVETGSNGGPISVNNISFRQIVWEVAPTGSNTVCGIAVHPTNGKLYRITSTNGTKTAEVYSPTGLDAAVSGMTLEFTKGE